MADPALPLVSAEAREITTPDDASADDAGGQIGAETDPFFAAEQAPRPAQRPTIGTRTITVSPGATAQTRISTPKRELGPSPGGATPVELSGTTPAAQPTTIVPATTSISASASLSASTTVEPDWRDFATKTAPPPRRRADALLAIEEAKVASMFQAPLIDGAPDRNMRAWSSSPDLAARAPIALADAAIAGSDDKPVSPDGPDEAPEGMETTLKDAPGGVSLEVLRRPADMRQDPPSAPPLRIDATSVDLDAQVPRLTAPEIEQVHHEMAAPRPFSDPSRLAMESVSKPRAQIVTALGPMAVDRAAGPSRIATTLSAPRTPSIDDDAAGATGATAMLTPARHAPAHATGADVALVATLSSDDVPFPDDVAKRPVAPTPMTEATAPDETDALETRDAPTNLSADPAQSPETAPTSSETSSLVVVAAADAKPLNAPDPGLKLSAHPPRLDSARSLTGATPATTTTPDLVAADLDGVGRESDLSPASPSPIQIAPMRPGGVFNRASLTVE